MRPRIAALIRVATTRGELSSVISGTPDLLRDWRAGRVSPQVKRMLVMAVLGAIYIVAPVDLLPEAILGPIGLLDDAAVAAWTLNGLVEAVQLHRRQVQPGAARVA